MRTAAILPVKRFPLAKQRLGESVADSLRSALAQAMVGDVLSALRECSAIDATIVVTCEPSVVTVAHYIGAIVVEDSAEEGQSAAVSLGLARALLEGFERALCVPGDCPTLDPDELRTLLTTEVSRPAEGSPSADPAARLSADPVAGLSADPVARLSADPVAGLSADPAARSSPSEVVIVPDRHGSGTNGLLLVPPNALSPSFGPDSCARHERLAHEAGARWRIEQPSSLLLDIDTGEDLAALRKRLAGEQVRAPRTRTVLARAGTPHSQAPPSHGQAPQAS